MPSADRYSSGPQLEYPCSTHAGNAAVNGSGNVDRISSPGAAMSLNCGSRFEKAGEPPVRLSALTPRTCGSAAGQLAYGQGCDGAWSELPTAATTRTPFETA